jgi:putative FmdB family regulatory protein
LRRPHNIIEDHQMPLYEYACQECQHTFEELVFGDEAVTCPSCQSARLERLLSTPARPPAAAGLPTRCEGSGPPCGAPWCQRQ